MQMQVCSFRRGSKSNNVAFLGSDLPAFVPVHDPTRKAYLGIRGTKTFSVRYETDRLGSRIPKDFMNLEGLFSIFNTKVVRHPSPDSSVKFYQIVLLLYSILELYLSSTTCFLVKMCAQVITKMDEPKIGIMCM